MAAQSRRRLNTRSLMVRLGRIGPVQALGRDGSCGCLWLVQGLPWGSRSAVRACGSESERAIDRAVHSYLAGAAAALGAGAGPAPRWQPFQQDGVQQILAAEHVSGGNYGMPLPHGM